MKDDFEKKRYWGRSIFGFRNLSWKNCNKSHIGLHQMCLDGVVPFIITQNVDGLHHLARHGGVWRGNPQELYLSPNGVALGAESCGDFGASVTNGELCELHGNIHLVKCMSCGAQTSREFMQGALEAANKHLLDAVSVDMQRVRPDADYELDDALVDKVSLVPCDKCGGYLRPDVVLFGESVPPTTVAKCFDSLAQCPTLICFGTSLHVFSSFRFVKWAAENGHPIVIVNRGPTRGDSLATLKVETDSVGEFIDGLQIHLSQCL